MHHTTNSINRSKEGKQSIAMDIIDLLSELFQQGGSLVIIIIDGEPSQQGGGGEISIGSPISIDISRIFYPMFKMN